MPTDSTPTTENDTPAGAHQHRWKRAARDDQRLGPVHLAVVDAYAEHFYAGKASMRGVGLSVERIEWWTRYKSTAIRNARAQLVRWGWLSVVTNRGRGRVARYALTIPAEFSTDLPLSPTGSGRLSTESAPVASKATTRPSNPVEPVASKATTRPSNPDRRPPRGLLPLLSPTPNYPPAGEAAAGELGAQDGPPRGRQAAKPIPNRTERPESARNSLALVLPPGVLESPRGARSVVVLAQALAGAVASGWTLDQVRAELEGCDQGAREPVGVIVSRLRDLAGRPAPAPVVAGPSPDRLDVDALESGRMCPHGDPDRRTAAGVHRCPICRRIEAGQGAGKAAGA